MNFNSGFFNSANDGWVVGTDGVILHFDGVNYGTVTSPTINNFTSISFGPPLTGPINANDGWAVGNASLRTLTCARADDLPLERFCLDERRSHRDNEQSQFRFHGEQRRCLGRWWRTTNNDLHYPCAQSFCISPGALGIQYLLLQERTPSNRSLWSVRTKAGRLESKCDVDLVSGATGIILHYSLSGGVGTWAIFPAPSIHPASNTRPQLRVHVEPERKMGCR